MTWVCDVYYRYSNSQYNELRDVILLCFTVLNMLCCWRLFPKAGYESWKGLIPVYNFWIMNDIVFGNSWYALLALVPVVNAVYSYFFLYQLAKVYGKSSGFCIAMMFFAPLFMPLLAFSGDAYYEGPSKKRLQGVPVYGGRSGGYGNGGGYPQQNNNYPNQSYGNNFGSDSDNPFYQPNPYGGNESGTTISADSLKKPNPFEDNSYGSSSQSNSYGNSYTQNDYFGNNSQSNSYGNSYTQNDYFGNNSQSNSYGNSYTQNDYFGSNSQSNSNGGYTQQDFYSGSPSKNPYDGY